MKQFSLDKPTDPTVDISERKILSRIRRDHFIYGIGLYSKPSYFQMSLSSGDRVPIFQKLSFDTSVNWVRELDNGMYFACMFTRSNTHQIPPRGVILDVNGEVRKTFLDTCYQSMRELPDSAFIPRESLERTNSGYYITNNGTITVLSDVAKISSLYNQSWNDVSFDVQTPNAVLTYWNAGMPQRLTLTAEYVRQLPGQPPFPTSKHIYWSYGLHKFGI